MAVYHPEAGELKQGEKRQFRPIKFITAALIATIITIFAGLYLGYAYVARSDYVFQGVTVGGVAVGNMSADRLAEKLATDWQSREITISTDMGNVTVSPVDLGIDIDNGYLARAAWEAGRNSSPWWLAPFNSLDLQTDIAPRYIVDEGVARVRLAKIAEEVDQLAVQPQIVIVDGVAQAQPGEAGRVVDIDASMANWQEDWFPAVVSGEMQLVTVQVNPAEYAMARYVDEVNAVLARPLIIHAYDPIIDEAFEWQISPEVWGSWVQFNVVDEQLTTDGNLPAISDFITQINASSESRYLPERDAEAIANVIALREPIIELRFFYPERVYTAVAGDTIASIGTQFGIPYPWIEKINPEIDPTRLRPGDQVVIPSPDSMIPLPILRDKRIVIDLSEQSMVAIENGNRKWEWPISSGEDGSPTSPGVFQIQTHVPSAWSNSWQLNLPNFMGFYRPAPDIDFMNGFHGFPTQDDGTVVWTDRIGKQGTFGCVMLADEQMVQLYEWAEPGMIVEIVQ